MAYLSADGYDYDIFVSYAHVDDRPMPGAAQGWVTTFANCIKTKLAQKLGRNDAYALWMDYELRGGQPITPHILDKLQRSATLFVVLSPGYLKSVWCQRELDTFAGMVANGQARSVFVVELEPHDEAELPRPLADLKRSPFWTKDKKTGNPHRLGELVQDADEYYSAIDDFVREVVTDLKQPKRAAAAATPAIATAAAGNGAVFLAEVTDDLDEQRNSVKRYLDQAGIAVLPKDGFPLEPNAFRRAVSEGLAGADLFVQLLSGVAGKRPPDLPEGRAACQLQLALSLGRPVLHWRSAEIDVKAISDAGQRALLDAASVRAEGIEDFKREIRRRLDERRNQPVRPVADRFLCLRRHGFGRPAAGRAAVRDNQPARGGLRDAAGRPGPGKISRRIRGAAAGMRRADRDLRCDHAGLGRRPSETIAQDADPSPRSVARPGHHPGSARYQGQSVDHAAADAED